MELFNWILFQLIDFAYEKGIHITVSYTWKTYKPTFPEPICSGQNILKAIYNILKQMYKCVHMVLISFLYFCPISFNWKWIRIDPGNAWAIIWTNDYSGF